MLDKLKVLTGGDKNEMQRHIDSYIGSMTGRVNTLKNALEEESYHDIGQVVKNAKFQFETMGFDDLWKLANHIERGVNKVYSKEMAKEHTLEFIKDLEESIDKLEKIKL